MSKKVLFYLVLDLIGVVITLIIRSLLCNAFITIPDLWMQSALNLAVNIASGVVILFIILFFLLYWWSDRKWESTKKNLQSLKDYIKRN